MSTGNKRKYPRLPKKIAPNSTIVYDKRRGYWPSSTTHIFAHCPNCGLSRKWLGEEYTCTECGFASAWFCLEKVYTEDGRICLGERMFWQTIITDKEPTGQRVLCRICPDYGPKASERIFDEIFLPRTCDAIMAAVQQGYLTQVEADRTLEDYANGGSIGVHRKRPLRFANGKVTE